MSHNPILESLTNRLSEEACQFLIDFDRRHQFNNGDTVVHEGRSHTHHGRKSWQFEAIDNRLQLLG